MSTVTAFSESLADLATETTKAGKSSVPAVHDPALAEDIERFVEARRQRETWEAIEQTTAAQIREAGLAHRLRISQQSRKATATVCLNGKVQVQQVNKYSAIPASLEQRCRDMMGDQFDRYLTESLTVTATPIGVQMLQEMMATVGKDRMQEDRTIVPQSATVKLA